MCDGNSPSLRGIAKFIIEKAKFTLFAHNIWLQLVNLIKSSGLLLGKISLNTHTKVGKVLSNNFLSSLGCKMLPGDLLKVWPKSSKG